MEEIEALYCPEGNNNSETPKACWFPFQKTYTRRRRITPGEEEHTGAIVLSKPVPIPFDDDHVDLEEQFVVSTIPSAARGDAAASSISLRRNELRRSFLTEAETNSIISEGDHRRMVDTMEQQHSVCHQNLAEINANPLSRQFWVDEVVVEGGSLNCGGGGQSFVSSKKRQSSQQPMIPDIAFSQRQQQNTTPRIEVEYDSKHKHGSVGAAGSRGATTMSSSMGSSTRLAHCSPFRFGGGTDNQKSTTTSVSLDSNEDDDDDDAWTASIDGDNDSLPGRMRSFGSKDDTTVHKTNSLPSVVGYQKVVPAATTESSTSKRLLCGAISSSSQTRPAPLGRRNSNSNKPKVRSGPTVGKVPSAVKVRPTSSTIGEGIEDDVFRHNNAEGAKNNAAKRSVRARRIFRLAHPRNFMIP